jgi:hypothetical protein
MLALLVSTGTRSTRALIGRGQRSRDGIIIADLGSTLSGLSREGGMRWNRFALEGFPQRAVTGCDWNAVDRSGGITGEAEAVNEFVAKVEVCLADLWRRQVSWRFLHPVSYRLRDLQPRCIE